MKKMGAPEESLSQQDPDYISAVSNNEAQQKIYEESARNATARKITTIIEKEFSREIDLKEKEILQIQERLHKALKTLHLLRYVIITDFYNRKQCQASQAAETTKQTRIHPAVKSLFGKSPKFTHYTDPAVPSTSTDPRYLPNNEFLTSALNITTLEDNKSTANAESHNNESQTPKRKLENEEFRPRKIPRYVPPKSSKPENTSPSRGTRHKARKRIIVGNISKWIPPDWREDAASHKWTMYVRGDKEDADISTFISKVRFFLHPSYRPNDVVEVTSSPFYLSRRGWGEFPLRVQLHFKNALNKPMDIIHHLKLDRTYTGLQTLGSETLVDVWIHTIDFQNLDQNNSTERIESSSINTFDETKTNNNVNFEFSERSIKSEETLEYSETSQPVASISQVCMKKENAEINEIFNLSIDPMLIEDFSEHKNIKAESNDAILDSNIFTTLDRSSLEQIRYNINCDHDYLNKQYFDFPKHTVREGNVTIEHFPENECAFATNSLSSNSNENKHNSTIITSDRYNCDIESSSNCQFLAIENLIKDEANLSTLQMSLEYGDFQTSDNHDVALPVSNSIQSEDSILHNLTKLPFVETNTLSRILENDGDCIKSNTLDNIVSSDKIVTQSTLTTVNGFYKPSNSSFERLNNLRRSVTSSNHDSHLKPLEISIPPPFSSSTSKRIVVMKDKKLIPVDVTNISSSNANEDSKKVANVPITRHNITKLNIPHGVSILKKPFANSTKINTQQENTIKKETTILTLKTSNSLLLNVNCDVPALKIANSRDMRYSYNLPDTTKSVPLTSQEESYTKSENKNEKMQRTKITLGKDKHKIQSKRELYEAVFETIETANILDTEALIRFIIRRLPIVTKDACDPDYKRLHPYACYSEDEFFAHNPGKQRALEWNRAKTIRSFLRKKQVQEDCLWTVKEIIIWARLHGYTPYRKFFSAAKMDTADGMKKLPNFSATSILSTCTEPIAFKNWLQTCQQESNQQSTSSSNDLEDTIIDIETIEEDSHKVRNNPGNKESSNELNNSMLIPLELDSNLMPLHNFVCDSARDIGIKIGPEEIVPNVMYCAASRAMIEVIKCFVEDLARASLAKAWERSSSNGCPQSITLNDVRNAIISREEFDIFTNDGLGSRQQLNTTN